MLDPNEDGVSHINIYSKGKTEIGRFLSNFSDCDIQTEDGFFRTIEGYWYWLSVKDDRLRHTSGFASKELGRELRGKEWPGGSDLEFEQKIMKAIMIKMSTSQWCVDELIKTGNKPFFHYYVYGSKVIMVRNGYWMLDLILEFRDALVRKHG